MLLDRCIQANVLITRGCRNRPATMLACVQELDNAEQKEVEDDSVREDMLWRVNTEVHDPDIGVVSLSALLA